MKTKRSLISLTRQLVETCNLLGYETEFNSQGLFIFAQHGCFIGSTVIEHVPASLTCYVSSSVEGRVYLCVYSD